MFNASTLLSRAQNLGLFTTGLLGIATSQSFAQSLDVQVNSDLEIISFDVTGATPSSSITLAIDFPQCSADVTGDRITDVNDKLAIQSAFGPALTPDRKNYDLNNDGFINQADVDVLEASDGCSDVQSTPIPGCGTNASINPVTMRRFILATNASGEASFDIPLSDHFDQRIYAQVVDTGSCEVSPLRPFYALGSEAFVAPESEISAFALSDFMEVVPSGLIGIETNLAAGTFTKKSSGQSESGLPATPGTVASVTLQETPASFMGPDGAAETGVMLGMRSFDVIPEGEYSAGRIQALIQPFAVDGLIGNQSWAAPFHGLFDINQPFQNAAYPTFEAQVGVLTTPEAMQSLASYYAVDDSMLESASAAIFLRVDESVELNVGDPAQHGFGIHLVNFPEFQDDPFTATRHLTTGDASDDKVAAVELIRFQNNLISLHVTGSLEAGDHLFLLSEQEFDEPSGSYTTNPPTMVATSGASDSDCGTPEPPTNPPAVGGDCTPTLGALWQLDDCVITNNFTVSPKVCGTAGPFLAATSGGAEGVGVDKDLETKYKGSATVGVSFGGADVKVGREVSHTKGIKTDYRFRRGNGCGQNIAWYLYVKVCVKRYSINYHTWEGWFPDWCAGCCKVVYRTCVAGESVMTEVCDRDC